MAKYRRGRINDAVAEEMAVALRELRDPRLTDSFVSITRADVAGDLRVAKIYFSAMGDSEVYKAAKAALEKATGKFRHHLAVTLNLRITPTLIFVPDTSMEHGAHIAQLLADIHREDAARAAANSASAEEETGEEDEEDV